MSVPSWMIAPGLRARDGKRHWARDIAAGVTVGAVSVPSAIAFAELARLPAAPGLYAAAAGLIAYALVGSARILVVGADTATAVLSASAIATIATRNTRPVDVAAALAIATGVLLIVGAIARAGFVANFLAKPVLVGYVHGLIVTAVVAELGSLLRVPVDGTVAISGVADLVREWRDWHMLSFLFGLACLAAIAVLHRVARRIPASLVVVVLATAVAWIGDWRTEYGLRIVGFVPQGLPAPRIPDLTLTQLGTLSLFAIGLAALSIADTTSVARLFAARNGDELVPDRELAAIGAADAASGIVGGLAVSGSAPRTAISWEARTKSQVAGVVAGATIGIVLLAFTAAIEQIPKAALAAVVIAAVVTVASPREFVDIYRFRRSEGAIAIVTFVSVVLFGAAPGMGVAVVLSALNVLRREATPHDAELGRVPNLHGWHDVARYRSALLVPDVMIYRFDAPLFFANAVALRDGLLQRLDAAGRPIRWVVIDAEGITDVDITSIGALEELLQKLRERNVGLSFARLTGEVHDALRRGGFLAQLGDHHVYPNVAGAIRGEANEEPPEP